MAARLLCEEGGDCFGVVGELLPGDAEDAVAGGLEAGVAEAVALEVPAAGVVGVAVDLNAAMELEEPPGREAMPDRLPPKARGDQLRTADDLALSTGDLGDDSIAPTTSHRRNSELPM